MTPSLLAAADARFQSALRDPVRAQHDLLLSILARNASCEYGRKLGFSDIKSVRDYRARVPLVTYDDIRSYHARAAAGEPDVIFAGPPVFVCSTTGTTSPNQKVFAYPAEVAVEYHHYLGPAIASMERDHPGSTTHSLRAFLPGWKRNAAGILVGYGSGFASHIIAGLPNACPIPGEIMECDGEQMHYGLLRIGLQLPVRSLAATVAVFMATLLRRGTEYGEALADDLAAGTLTGPGFPPEVLAAAAPHLRADAAMADRLRASLRANGRFVPRDVWPDLAVIQTWKGGTSRYDLETIALHCPGVPIRPQNSGSTEASLLVPLADAWTGGVPSLLTTFYEFIPADADPRTADALDVTDLREGEGYRMIVTSHRGVYRYPLDDVFYVEAMHGRVPVLTFSHRIDLSVSFAAEKLNEHHVCNAIDRAAADVRCTITEFEIVPYRANPSRYLVTLEHDGDDATLHALLAAFEQELHRRNQTYGMARSGGYLGAPELGVMPPGYFAARRRQMVQGTSKSEAHIKLPRLRVQPIDDRATIPALRWLTM